MTPGPHLLVVDDEAGIRESLSSILEDEGYHVEAVGSAEEAWSALPPAISRSFCWTSGFRGSTASKPKPFASVPRPRSHHDFRSRHNRNSRACHKARRLDFIEKPLSLEKIIVLVRNAIQQRRLEDENQLLRSELGYRYQLSATAFR